MQQKKKKNTHIYTTAVKIGGEYTKITFKEIMQELHDKLITDWELGVRLTVKKVHTQCTNLERYTQT